MASRDLRNDEVSVMRHDGSGSTWDADTTAVMAIPRHEPEYVGPELDPFKTQVGGNHYRHFAIQPTEFIMKNKMNFVEGNIIKYVTRYKIKNGLEDLKKARHYLDILIAEVEKEDISTRREF